MPKKPKLGKMRRYLEVKCPNCGKLLDSSIPIGHDDAPWDLSGKPGDEAITVCNKCARLLKWDKLNGQWLLVPPEDIKAVLDETPHLRDVMNMTLNYIVSQTMGREN